MITGDLLKSRRHPNPTAGGQNQRAGRWERLKAINYALLLLKRMSSLLRLLNLPIATTKTKENGLPNAGDFSNFGVVYSNKE